MSVFKRNGKWGVGLTGPDGRWMRKIVGNSYSLAREVEAKLKAEAAEGKFFPDRVAKRQTFESLSARYLELHGPALRSSTWKWMLARVNTEFGKRPVGNITARDIQAFYNKTEELTSTSTANRYLTLVRAVFNKAKSWGMYYGENPCTGVKKKQEPANRLRYLSEAEIRTLMANCDPRIYPVVACALMTGMRRGEILNLDWRDIDFMSNTIQILQSKSGKPRKIPIAPPLKTLLKEMPPASEGKVFDIPVITLRRLFAKALEASRIDSFRFHDLRHTFASHFAMKTGHLPYLQKILGHSTPQMTLRYAHLSDSDMAAKMDLVSEAIPIERPAISVETETVRIESRPLVSIPRT